MKPGCVGRLAFNQMDFDLCSFESLGYLPMEVVIEADVIGRSHRASSPGLSPEGE